MEHIDKQSHQSAAFPHVVQPLQNLRQAWIVRVHKPYWRRRWIRFLKTTKDNNFRLRNRQQWHVYVRVVRLKAE